MKRNRIQLYLFGILAGSLLAGCTAGSVEDVVPENSLPVTLSFGKPDLGIPELLTRAGTNVAPAATLLPEGSTVRICAYFVADVGEEYGQASFATTKPSFEATYVIDKNGAMKPCNVDAEGNPSGGDAKELTVRGGIYDFYAVSPARPLENDNGNYAITGIPHKEDLMTSFAREVTVTKSSRQVTLGSFVRKCAMVVFNVAPSEDNALTFTNLYGTKLVVSQISSSGASLIAGEDTGISPTGGGSGTGAQVEFGTDDFEVVDAGSDPDGLGLNKAIGVVLPKNNQPFNVEINVVRNNKTETLRAVIDKKISFEEGKRYIFTLKVNNKESQLLMKVVGWNTQVFRDDSVGAPDGPYPDPDIVEGIGIAETIATWTENAN